jgi:hypothetical protein
LALPAPTLTPAEQSSQTKITRTEADTANFAITLLAKNKVALHSISRLLLLTLSVIRQNADGMINRSGLPEVLQIGYYDDYGIKLAWIIHLKKILKLPVALKILLALDRFKFVEVNVGVDVKGTSNLNAQVSMEVYISHQ